MGIHKELIHKELIHKELIHKELIHKEMLLKEMPMLVHQTQPPNKPMYSMKMETLPQQQPRLPMMIQPLKTMTPLETTPQLDLPARQPALCSLLWPSESLPLTTSKKNILTASLN